MHMNSSLPSTLFNKCPFYFGLLFLLHEWMSWKAFVGHVEHMKSPLISTESLVAEVLFSDRSCLEGLAASRLRKHTRDIRWDTDIIDRLDKGVWGQPRETTKAIETEFGLLLGGLFASALLAAMKWGS